ncbi:MAG: glycerate kinase [Candidatus Hermodarchaeota archaeon]
MNQGVSPIHIQNLNELLNENLEISQLYLRKIALETLERAIDAVKPQNLINSSIRIQNNILTIQNDDYDLNNFRRLYIIGGGKATAEMALSLEKILTKKKNVEYDGFVNIPKDSINPEMLKKSIIKFNYASHPIPDQSGFDGAKEMLKIIKESKREDLIIFLLSGGGSALLPLPKKGISLEDLQKLNSLLLASGASIHEINTIRKHLSVIKGGNIAKTLWTSSGAKLVSLIISDVVGDNLDSIASGPTVPDSSTFQDTLAVLEKYNLYEQLPISIRNHVRDGMKKKRLETPKSGDRCFNNVHNYLLGSVKNAVERVVSFLETKGFNTISFSNEITGESVDFGKILYKTILEKLKNPEKNNSSNLALIGTGELTVKIKGNGVGGRNQEMLLSFSNYIKDREFPHEFLILGANLDGIEGNSQAMGALVDNYILNQINKDKINIMKYLENNDSNSFFKLTKSEIITGPTGCNVNDIVIVLLQI